MSGAGPEVLRDRLLAAARLHAAGRHAEAEQACRALLRDAAGQPGAASLLAVLCLRSGRAAEARDLLVGILAQDAGNAQAHYNLGIACRDLGDLAAAERAFRRAAELQPRDADSLNAHGNVLRLLGNGAAARAQLQRALAIAPDHPDPCCNLGLLLRYEGSKDEAEAWLRRALAAAPGHGAARRGLGELLLDGGRFEEAEASLNQAVALRPADADAWNDLGVARNKRGDAQGAMTAFERAVKIKPGHARAWINLGILREQVGRFAEAADAYQRSIRAAPEFVDAHYQLAQLRTRPATTAEVAAMQSLAATALDDRQRARLLHGLGIALESLGRHDEAFASWKEAHALQRRYEPFDIRREAAYCERIERLIDSALVTRLQAGGVLDARPILLVGLPRSGTTLAEQVLASHPQVTANGESTALAEALSISSGQPGSAYPESVLSIRPESLRTAAQGFLETMAPAARCGGPDGRFTDTTPANWQLLGFAAAMLPQARFVCCVRDPLDQCVSIYRQWFTGAQSYAHDLADLGAYHSLYGQLVAHWQRLLPDRVHVLKYESMVANPEQEIRALLDFCGLPFDPRCLRFDATDRRVRTPSASQVRRPVYRDSVGAWRRYQSHLGPLLDLFGNPGS